MFLFFSKINQKKYFFDLFFCFFYFQQYIDEIKNIDKFKQNLSKLAKPVVAFLKEEKSDSVDSIKTKLNDFTEQILR